MPQVVKHQTGITSLPTEILFKIISLLPVDVCLQIIGSSCRTLSPLVLQSLHSARSHIKLQMAITYATSIYQYLSIRQLEGKRWLSLPVVYKFACYELLLTGDPHRAANMTIRASNDDDGESVLPTQEPEGHDGEVEWEEIDVEEDEDEDDEDEEVEDGYEVEMGEEDDDDLELLPNWPLTGPQSLQLAQVLSRNNSFDIGCSNQRLFRWAVESGHTKAVEFLLKDNRIDPAVYENDPIASATRMGHVEITRLLLADSRVDPAVKENTPIALACENGHAEVVRILLQDPRVDPCDDCNSALEAACEHGHLEVVKVLLHDRRVDPGFNDSMAFQLAVQYNHLEVTSLLMENKRVDPSCYDGQTLINAIRHRNTEMVKLLLSDSRMNPTASSRLRMHQLRVGGYEILSFDTALIEAASQGSVEIMKILLKHCRTGNSFDHALLAAVVNDFPEIVKILLEDGRADPGYQNSMALIQASLRADVDMVRLLMEDGRSDPSTNMQEAFVNACYINSREIAELLAKDRRVNPHTLWKCMANDRETSILINSITEMTSLAQSAALLSHTAIASPHPNERARGFELLGHLASTSTTSSSSTSTSTNWLVQTLSKEPLRPTTLPAHACGAFVHGAEDEYEVVRSAAVDAITEFALSSPAFTPLAIDFLVDMFNDEMPSVRLTAIKNLKRIGLSSSSSSSSNTTPPLSLSESQLITMLLSLDDVSQPMRFVGYSVLALFSVASKDALLLLLERLRRNLKRFSTVEGETNRILQCFKDVGARNSTLVAHSGLVEALLKLDTRFLAREIDLDSLEPDVVSVKCEERARFETTDYLSNISNTILLVSASLTTPPIATTLPHYTLQQSVFLCAKYPSCFPASSLSPSTTSPDILSFVRETSLQLTEDLNAFVDRKRWQDARQCIIRVQREMSRIKENSGAAEFMRDLTSILLTVLDAIQHKSSMDSIALDLQRLADKYMGITRSLQSALDLLKSCTTTPGFRFPSFQIPPSLLPFHASVTATITPGLPSNLDCAAYIPVPVRFQGTLKNWKGPATPIWLVVEMRDGRQESVDIDACCIDGAGIGGVGRFEFEKGLIVGDSTSLKCWAVQGSNVYTSQ
ncbi:ankyrin [Rhizoclosmatium globosum]|uniref:Ankyrin n=1 Tax=Rhizoclosmatium globosum TaxID=329046 RepID=A0A1Y2BPF4_9FUNG|nr:ankyrin [Rhizoclosmatium globosum]|eukprot:ORY36630.1 ankyrin [Rhizoclosmatium globosum]